MISTPTPIQPGAFATAPGRAHVRGRACMLACTLAGLSACAPAIAPVPAPAQSQPQERRNWFDDPFEQATAGLPGCPVPEGPLMTEPEMRGEAHYRVERGTSCWLAGRCADSNAYRRDRETSAGVQAVIRADARFAHTSVWTTTQRRFVYLQGCVRDEAQRAALVALVRAQPGVELVLDELMIGTRGKPPYAIWRGG